MSVHTFAMLGDTNVGKTTLVAALRKPARRGDRFVQYRATIGHDMYHMASYTIIDTAGQERFKSLIPVYLRGVKTVLLCFEYGDRLEVSLASALQTWHNGYIKKYGNEVSILLLCLKCDVDRMKSCHDYRVIREISKIVNYLREHMTSKSVTILKRMPVKAFVEISTHKDINVNKLSDLMTDMVKCHNGSRGEE